MRYVNPGKARTRMLAVFRRIAERTDNIILLKSHPFVERSKLNWACVQKGAVRQADVSVCDVVHADMQFFSDLDAWIVDILQQVTSAGEFPHLTFTIVDMSADFCDASVCHLIGAIAGPGSNMTYRYRDISHLSPIWSAGQAPRWASVLKTALSRVRFATP